MEQHYAEEQAHDALRGQLGTAYDGGLLAPWLSSPEATLRVRFLGERDCLRVPF